MFRKTEKSLPLLEMEPIFLRRPVRSVGSIPTQQSRLKKKKKEKRNECITVKLQADDMLTKNVTTYTLYWKKKYKDKIAHANKSIGRNCTVVEKENILKATVVVCNSSSIQWTGGLGLSYLPHYFELKKLSNLTSPPNFFKKKKRISRGWMGGKFASKYISMC